MPYLLKSQGWTSMTCWWTKTVRNSHVEMRLHFDGFDNGVNSDCIKEKRHWLIVDRLTKSAHIVAINDSWEVDRLAQIYVKEVVQLVYLKTLS